MDLAGFTEKVAQALRSSGEFESVDVIEDTEDIGVDTKDGDKYFLTPSE